MNYTANYHLPQWVKSDRIMMEDFNDAMSAMEDGMTATAADSAQAVADAAQAKQLAEEAYFVTGTYVGGGVDHPTSVNLGFRPSFVIISGHSWGSSITDHSLHRFGLMFDGNGHGYGQITDTGFIVQELSVGGYPRINLEQTTYGYIAFR